MSIFASPKVQEVVRRLPKKIRVGEVPRLSTWPTQFPKDYATEDNVALYFFAEDLERFVWVLPRMNSVSLSLAIYLSFLCCYTATEESTRPYWNS